MGITTVPNQFFEQFYPQLSSSEKILFIGLSYLSQGKPEFNVSQLQLQAFCGLSHSTVSVARWRLIREGLLQVSKPRRNSPIRYKLLIQVPHEEQEAKIEAIRPSRTKYHQPGIQHAAFLAWAKLVQEQIQYRVPSMRDQPFDATNYYPFFLEYTWPVILERFSDDQFDVMMFQIERMGSAPEFLAQVPSPLPPIP